MRISSARGASPAASSPGSQGPQPSTNLPGAAFPGSHGAPGAGGTIGTIGTFAGLGLSAALQDSLRARGYEHPTAVQAAALPPALQGRDVLACARTGSGKTAAFVLALLQRLEDTARDTPRGNARDTLRRTRALVLVPTRELALQVGEIVRDLADRMRPPPKVVALFGGVSINPQMMTLRGGAEVVVATPGRLLDVVEHGALSLAHVTVLVLDEADRLLDAGFADELARVLALLPARRQQLLFSATFAPAVQALARTLLHDEVRVDVTAAPADLPDIAQRAIEVDPARRTPLLHHLVEHHGWTRVLVFVATRYASEHVADKLRRAGINAAAFHGDASQGARRAVLDDFKAGRLQVVVATDLAARGIDIEQLPVVVNHDLPRSAADYVHRIGRTARAGASGMAVSFVSPSTEAHFRLIEKRQGRRVPRERVTGFEPAPIPAPSPSGSPPDGAAEAGGIKGRRKSRKDKLREAAARDGG